MSITRKIAVIGALSAVAATLFTGTASAKTEKNCTASFCNTTDGSGLYVNQVIALRQQPIKAKYGYFQVFGRGWSRGPTSSGTTAAQIIHIGQQVVKNELVCLRFVARENGKWKEIGPPACTTAPF
ncbi:hypothetical protein ABZU76_41105 [Amycolatopsis sp. NPDC005232]|uniref:hypothetical protein n=1 Tax=unclassified Amycolatopsis TaxID=2618356 RepID=UPI001C6A76F6|nr:hypothetical protein [Amycolatopsis sp. DSM 110486]QYN19959.1 hypothetical protein K1T34_46550 [Amycolatopsis sp. DSM 110486]